MRLAELAPSLIFVAAGVYMYSRPMSVRSFVSPRTWKESPEEATQLQRVLAKTVGFALVGVGVLWFVIVLALG